MIANAGMDVKKEKCSLLVEAQTSAAMTGINMAVPQKLSVYFAFHHRIKDWLKITHKRFMSWGKCMQNAACEQD